MRRVLVLTAAVVVLTANAWTLIAAWRNRSGPSGGTMELTERELRLVEVPWESTATSLELSWDTLESPEGHGRPAWLDATKLEELGFDCSLAVDSANAKEHYASMPPTLVFVVLEYEGEAWRQARRGRELKTRLFLVDAGRDAHRLRDQYTATKKYVITRGVVGLLYQEGGPEDGAPLATPRLQGWIMSVLPSQIFVPRPHNRVLEEFRQRSPSRPVRPKGEPRFAVTVSWGSNYEPWVHGARPLVRRSLEKSSEETYGIDYEHPEVYLAAGPQSEVSAAHFAEVAEYLETERVDLSAIGRLYDWKASRFEDINSGGRYIGRRTVGEIFEERTLTGCHDHGLLLASLLRKYGVPAILVDATGIGWALRYPEEATSFSGHVFVEAFLDGKWMLFDGSSGAYVAEYDPINPVIPFTSPGEPKGYYVMYKGLDPADYGITSVQQLNATQVRYAQMLKEEIDALEFPEYVVDQL